MDGARKSWLVAEWRLVWRFASTWAAAAAIGLLTIWNMMPAAVQAALPDGIELPVGLALWGFYILARVWNQQLPRPGETDGPR